MIRSSFSSFLLLLASFLRLLVLPRGHLLATAALQASSLVAGTRQSLAALSKTKKLISKDTFGHGHTISQFHGGGSNDMQRNLAPRPSSPVSPISPNSPVPPTSPTRPAGSPSSPAPQASTQGNSPTETCTPPEEVESYLQNTESGSSLSVTCPPGVYSYDQCTCSFYVEGNSCNRCHMCQGGQFPYAEDCSNLLPSTCAATDCDANCIDSSSFDEYVNEEKKPKDFLGCSSFHDSILEVDGPTHCTEFICPSEADSYVDCQCKHTIDGQECQFCEACDPAGALIGVDCSNIIDKFPDGSCAKNLCSDEHCPTCGTSASSSLPTSAASFAIVAGVTVGAVFAG